MSERGGPAAWVFEVSVYLYFQNCMTLFVFTISVLQYKNGKFSLPQISKNSLKTAAVPSLLWGPI